MKDFNLFIILTALVFTTKAQEVVMNFPRVNQTYNSPIISKTKIVPLIEDTSYTYKYKGDDVLVIFTRNSHVEYFNNKKYSIKSSLRWVSETECEMTIQKSNLPNFPFRNGTKLKMKINKIKRDKIYYESTLGGRSWTGKMKKLQ